MSLFKNKYENKWTKYKTKYKELQNNIEDHFDDMIYELSQDIETLREVSNKLVEFKKKIHLLELKQPIDDPLHEPESNVVVYGVDSPKHPFALNEGETANQKALDLFQQRDNNFK
jgi:hypothetical protein